MKNAIGRFGNKIAMKFSKHSSEILLGLGIAGMCGATFLACKATLKAEDILDRHKHNMELAKQAEEVAEPEDNYDIRKEKAAIFAQTTVGFIKLFGPAVALGALSITSILVSHNILHKRYLGVVAAYNTLSGAFDKYRERVRSELGDEFDKHFRYGADIKEVETVSKDEEGNKVTTKDKVATIKENEGPSIYAKIFDKSNPNWDRNTLFSRMFLTAQQNMANDILQARGHIFLNEIYDMLGFERTQAGAVTGWVLGNGADFVDFGMYDINNPDAVDFVNGKANSIVLDFNVDGVIWDKI